MILGQAQRISELNELRFASEVKGVPLIAFTSGKGGTGKTTLAVNFANLLSKKGKRTLVIDFDLNFANVHVLLNVFPQFTLRNFLNGENSIDEVIHKEKENLFFVFGESGSIARNGITKAQLNELFYKLKASGQFDAIILDTSSGGAPETLDILGFSDMIIVVATPEPTAVMDAYAIIKLILGQKINSEIFALINKSPNKREAETAFTNLSNAVKHFLKKEISFMGYLRENTAVKKAAIEQKLITDAKDQNKFNINLELLTQKLLAKIKSAKTF